MSCTLRSLDTDLYPDDKSYRQAKALIDNGDLGQIHAVETTGIDQADPNGMEILL